MKKILTIFAAMMMLAGCTFDKANVAAEDRELMIVSPSGAPALAFYGEISNEYFRTGDAKSILPELSGQGGSDIIVIDTVNGIKALNNGAEYELAATITFGNFYIAATGYDDNGKMDEGDYIVVFSQGATPDLVFHSIYGDAYDGNIHYVNAVSDAVPCLVKGINIADEERGIDGDPYVDYVMIAEPALSAAMGQREGISVYANIQEEYAAKNGGMTMIQASVFVKKDLEHELARNYLGKLEANIYALLDDPSLFASACEGNGLADEEIKDLFGVPNAKLAVKVLKENSIGLGFANALENKEAIDRFIGIFGMEKTDEAIYFK